MPDPTESSSSSPESASNASTKASETEESPDMDAAPESDKSDHDDDSDAQSSQTSQQTPEQPSLTDAFSEAAQEVLEKRLRWVGVLRKAVQRLGEEDSVPAVLARDIATLFRMVRAWRKGTYAHFPWRSVGVITLAVLYFLLMGRSSGGRSLAGLGIIDDTAILAFVVRTTHNELDRFRAWESQNAETDAEESPSDDEA
ncbi:MAG: YkvA family protein [Bacteroidota bacterium]